MRGSWANMTSISVHFVAYCNESTELCLVATFHAGSENVLLCSWFPAEDISGGKKEDFLKR